MANSDKTEQATPRRRQKAREKGQIARSRELMSSLAVGATVLILAAQVPGFVSLWRGLLRHNLEAAVSGDFENSRALLAWTGSTVFRAVGLIVGLSWLIAAVAAVAQGGLVFAGPALQPNFSRLNPATRLEQLFSLPSLGRLLKSLLPGTAIACLAASILMREWTTVLHLCRVSAAGITRYGLTRVFEIAWKSALVLLLWSGADYFIEKRKLEGDLRMSRQDLKDEYKETEGHPTVKARMRRLRRQVLRQKMLADVKRASVVITNPNEFAVALEYGPELLAPTVVAKGRNLLARQIKEAARWHAIPLVENPPLAHALYRAVEIGQSIPPKLYAVVASILAAIYRAQQRAEQTTRKAGA
ncbi:MAG TPA: EscU/YscU/HrcU family type III secretion system export apparatus switch protein [Terriglobales bacterium]|nr:EscU/YscU/HrcU family type III secretion system export apparatus switch protein [Terriglobales bacterium]